MSENDQLICASFSETEDYLVEATRRSPRHTRQWIICGVGVGMGIGVCIVFNFFSVEKGGVSRWYLIAGGLAAVGVTLYQQSPSGLCRQIRKEARKRTGPLEKNTFEFRAEGFTASGSDGKTTFYPWPAVPKVVLHVDGLIIYFTQRSYCWLPRSAFSNQQDFLAVKERIIGKVGNVERTA